MKNYLDLMAKILKEGEIREDRTGTGTLSLFGERLEFDLRGAFPIVTTKQVHFKSVVGELLWFLSGSTKIKDLHAMGVKIWDSWSNSEGDLPHIYGEQWRNFGSDGFLQGADQINSLISQIKADPLSRRHIVSAWNPGVVDFSALAPCHVLFQMYVSNNGELSCHMYQRSADIFLGVPFNIASYALLTHMMAQQTGIKPGKLVISFGDVHLYCNHIEQARIQIAREPLLLPKLLLLGERQSIFGYKPQDFALLGYFPRPKIKGGVSV